MSVTNLPANISSVLDALEVVVKTTPAANQGGDFQFMKCAKGVYTYGVNNTEVHADSEWAIEPASYTQGYVAWKDGELVDERMATLGEAPIILSDLPTVGGDGWQVQKSVALLCVEGPDEGVQAIFKSSSVGGTRGIAELVSAIVINGRKNPSTPCPVVFLETVSYEHKNKSYGTIYNPVFNIVDWVASAPVEAEEEEDEKGEEVPVAKVEKKTRKATKAPEAEVEVEAEVEAEVEPKKRIRRSRK